MIDAAKGVGILCVYLGHLVLYGSLTFRAMTAAMSWGHVAMVMAVPLAAVTVMTFVARRPLGAALARRPGSPLT